MLRPILAQARTLPLRIPIPPPATGLSRALGTYSAGASARPRGGFAGVGSSQWTPPVRFGERIRTGVLLPAAGVGGLRTFHTTRRNQALPVLPLLAGILKTSTALELARTAVRIALTFVPVILIKNMKAKRHLQWAEARGDHEMAERVRAMRTKTVFFHVLLFIPAALFWATILASLERTPLTGRWRLILLSPEEEDDIAAQLAGPGWYQAVGEILSQDGPPPRLLPPTDWRMSWVLSTLRHLESVVPLLQNEAALEARWLAAAPDAPPLPPPATHPLRPRPRASEVVRQFAEMSCGRAVPRVPHGVVGPPYALIVVDEPGSSNAFSYGFGPDGGGGIVVFSGFLDDILSRNGGEGEGEGQKKQAEEGQRSAWQSLFGGLFGGAGASAPRDAHPVPTAAQTTELAILLAHELSHLILSHHLETLSSGSIIWPGILSITTDVVRAVLFPITMLFGPFVNDALASAGKVGSGEFTKLTEYCTSQKQEIEADVPRSVYFIFILSSRLLRMLTCIGTSSKPRHRNPSRTPTSPHPHSPPHSHPHPPPCTPNPRLLAHAGFDARHAVRFWSGRAESERTAECTPARAGEAAARAETSPMRWVGSSHPLNVVRSERLRQELGRWEEERGRERRRRGMDGVGEARVEGRREQRVEGEEMRAEVQERQEETERPQEKARESENEKGSVREGESENASSAA
ncbi:hypothetical protein EIP86_008287 [Pleurotus ostreatoroseus]|nr:hypothetical protein EIP86_008287 [Pleurotus ostreatoroseus]